MYFIINDATYQLHFMIGSPFMIEYTLLKLELFINIFSMAYFDY